MPNQLGEGSLGARFHPELRGPADPERRVFRERLVKTHVTFLANDGFELFGDHEVSRETGELLVNVPRAQTEDQVARGNHVSDIAMESVETRLVADSEMTVGSDFVRD